MNYLLADVGGNYFIISTSPSNVPTAPSGLSATAAGSSSINLLWTDDSNNETGFQIERSLDGSTNWTLVHTSIPGTTTYTDTGLSSNTTYYYRVRATGTGGNSGYTPIASATTGTATTTLLTSLTLTNTASSATPASTYYSFGHPFVKGDIPASSRLKATWTPSGSTESGALPIQVSSKVTWRDGSLKFASVGVILPSVVNSGSGVLKLYSEPGSQNTAIPGSRTAAQIAADLSVIDFRVSATKLRKGRDNLTVNSGGTGYRPNAGGQDPGTPTYLPPELAVVLASDGTTIVGGATTNSSGVVTYAWLAVPSVPYTNPLSVVVSNSTNYDGSAILGPNGSASPGYSGSGVAFTANLSTLDGSGSWTWKLSDQLAYLGTTDSKGRSRCEVIESGPLCVTYHSWGPYVDNVGGASHPHLVVRSWHRCWLDQTTGAIDRVEYLHNVEQGWIEDLNGGAVLADLQIGEFTVTVGGSTPAGQSWTGSFPPIRIPHHTAHSLTTGNNLTTTGGSEWTSGTPTLRPTFNNLYWRLSKLMPPYDVAYFLSNPVIPAADPTPSVYVPGSRSPGKMAALLGFNLGGENEHLGLVPHWTVKAYQTQAQTYLQTDFSMAFFAQQLPIRIRNPLTGRVPNLVDPALVADQSNALLGANRKNTYYFLPDASKRSSDIALTTPLTNYGGQRTASGPLDVTNQEGGWYGSGDAYTTAHWPTLTYYAYLRTGAPWFLETIRLHGHIGWQWRTPGVYAGQTSSNPHAGRTRDYILPDGTTLHGRMVRDPTEERNEAWGWKVLIQALGVLPDNAVDRPYYQSVYDANSAAVVKIINAGTPNFQNLGIWSFPLLTGTTLTFGGSAFMQVYTGMARGWEYLLLDSPADCLTFLQFYAKGIRGRCGGEPGQTCSWSMDSFHNLFGSSSTGDFFSGWDKMPYWLDSGTASFDNTTGLVTSTSIVSEGNYPMANGDMVLFTTTLGSTIGLGNVPPSPVVEGQFYYIQNLNTSTKKYNISTDPAGTNLVTGFATKSSIGVAYRFANCPVASSTLGSIQARLSGDQSAAFDMVQVQMVIDLLISDGLASTSDPWVQSVASRIATARSVKNWAGANSDYVNAPKYKTAPL